LKKFNFMGSVTIPGSVTNIGAGAFVFCFSLTNASIGNGVTTIGNGAFNSNPLTSVTIGTIVTSIESYAFDGTRLTSVTIPNSVTSIGNYAFQNCSILTNLAIGNSVTNIGHDAFHDCFGLASVYFQGEAPNVDSTAFGGESPTAYYLPGTMGWDDFANNTGVLTTLWLPKVQTSDASFGVQTNQFGFNIKWASGQTVVVEACTDLSNPVWTPVATNTITGGSSYFSDPQWTNYPGRFYRLRSP
jgi:hypothetical protein